MPSSRAAVSSTPSNKPSASFTVKHIAIALPANASHSSEQQESKEQLLQSSTARSEPSSVLDSLQLALPTKFQLSEPVTVIHRPLVLESLHRDLSYHYESSTVPSLQSIDASINTVQTLDLSFRSILTIDHLSVYGGLQKLQLDNNKIRKIENLDALVNLEWLDLSFNEITAIEGLASLTKLTDLSLAHNQITTIDNLDTLKSSLQCLSLNHNNIIDISSIKYLRSFQSLRVFSFKSNPCYNANTEDYYLTIYAFLPQLQYLDYAIIDTESVKKARDNKLDQLLILEQNEQVEKRNEKENELKRARKERNVTNGIVNIESLFSTLVSSDNDLNRFRVLPNFDTYLKEYESAFNTTIQEFEAKMSELNTLKTVEEKSMVEAKTMLIARADGDSKAVMKKWKQKLKSHTESLASITANTSNEDLTKSLSDLHSFLQTSCRELSSIEALRVTQRRDLHSELDKALHELSKQCLTETQAHFKALMAASANFSTQCIDNVHALQTQLAVDDKGFPIEIRAVLMDKDSLQTMLGSSRDHHDSHILAKEDEIREREEATLQSKVSSMRSDELTSNRQRVHEIYEWKKRQELQIEHLVKQIVANEEEDDDDSQ